MKLEFQVLNDDVRISDQVNVHFFEVGRASSRPQLLVSLVDDKVGELTLGAFITIFLSGGEIVVHVRMDQFQTATVTIDEAWPIAA